MEIFSIRLEAVQIHKEKKKERKKDKKKEDPGVSKKIVFQVRCDRIIHRYISLRQNHGTTPPT